MGRTGHAQFRVVAQDSRTHPSSGRVVAYLGSYDPHSKKVNIQADEISEFIKNGAQPSERVVKLLKKEGIKLPAWVSDPLEKKKSTRNPEKLRKNQPEKPAEEQPPAITQDAASDADVKPESPDPNEEQTEATAPKESEETKIANDVTDEPEADQTEQEQQTEEKNPTTDPEAEK